MIILYDVADKSLPLLLFPHRILRNQLKQHQVYNCGQLSSLGSITGIMLNMNQVSKTYKQDSLAFKKLTNWKLIQELVSILLLQQYPSSRCKQSYPHCCSSNHPHLHCPNVHLHCHPVILLIH